MPAVAFLCSRVGTPVPLPRLFEQTLSKVDAPLTAPPLTLSAPPPSPRSVQVEQTGPLRILSPINTSSQGEDVFR